MSIDGPFAETKELIAGYWMIQVKYKAEAIAWMKRCPNPHNEGGEIEIRQVFELEDFGESPAVDHHRALGETLPRRSSAGPQADDRQGQTLAGLPLLSAIRRRR